MPWRDDVVDRMAGDGMDYDWGGILASGKERCRG